jgi:hypothetical protein
MHPRPCVVSAACALACLPIVAIASDVNVEAVIARSGQAAPGAAGTTLGPMGTGALEGVSRNGNVVFRSTLSNATTFSNDALFAWDRPSHSLRLVAREGQPVPGWPAPAEFHTLAGRVAIDNQGRALFSDNPRAPFTPTGGGATGIFRQAGSAAPQLVLREGAVIAPLAPNALTSFDEFGPLASDGSLSLQLLEGTSANNARFAVLGNDDTLRIVLRADQPLPWAQGLAQVVVPPMPIASPSGAWIGRTRPGTAGPATLARRTSDTSALEPIAIVNTPLPGSAQAIFSLGSFAMNDMGDAAASFNLVGIQSGLWRFPASQAPTLVVQSGSTFSTPLGTASISQVGVGVGSVVTNNAGDVVFSALATIPTLGSVSCILFAPKSGAPVRLVAAVGSSVVTTAVVVGALPTNGFGLDDLGRVVLPASVSVLGSPQRKAILSWSPVAGSLSSYAIVQEDSVLFDAGDRQTLSDLSLSISLAGGGTGYVARPFISDDGFFVWQATFANATSAILAGQLPVECNSIDFNRDGLFPDDQDLVDFLSVLAGGDCRTAPPAGNGCDAIDFNNDGLFPDDNDLVSYLAVLAGGACR